MATTSFSERNLALDSIVDTISAKQKQVDEIKAIATAIIGGLSELPTTYAAHITDIAAEATANPTDTALTAHAAMLTQLVTEFTAMATLVQGILDDIG